MAEIPFAALLHHWVTWINHQLPAPYQARQIPIDDDDDDESETDRAGIHLVESGRSSPIVVGMVSREVLEDTIEVLGNDILHEQIMSRRITSLEDDTPLWCFAASGPNKIAFYQCSIHGVGRVNIGDFDVTMRRLHTAARLEKSTEIDAVQRFLSQAIGRNIRILNSL